MWTSGAGALPRGSGANRYGKPFYASVVLAGERLYAVGRSGDVYVLAANPELTLLAQNRFSNDDGGFNASPAIADGQLFIRSDKHLYCVAE